jgi:hypothetical protein
LKRGHLFFFLKLYTLKNNFIKPLFQKRPFFKKSGTKNNPFSLFLKIKRKQYQKRPFFTKSGTKNTPFLQKAVPKTLF